MLRLLGSQILLVFEVFCVCIFHHWVYVDVWVVVGICIPLWFYFWKRSQWCKRMLSTPQTCFCSDPPSFLIWKRESTWIFWCIPEVDFPYYFTSKILWYVKLMKNRDPKCLDKKSNVVARWVIVLLILDSSSIVDMFWNRKSKVHLLLMMEVRSLFQNVLTEHH